MRSHEKLQAMQSFNTEYLGLQIECMQIGQVLQGLLQRERYHEVLNKFRQIVCENVLFRYADYFEGNVKEIKNVLLLETLDVRDRMALQKRVDRELTMHRKFSVDWIRRRNTDIYLFLGLGMKYLHV